MPSARPGNYRSPGPTRRPGYGTTVTLFFDQAGGTVLGTAQPDVFGAFSVGATIPSSATAGANKIIAVGSDGRRAMATITVS